MPPERGEKARAAAQADAVDEEAEAKEMEDLWKAKSLIECTDAEPREEIAATPRLTPFTWSLPIG